MTLQEEPEAEAKIFYCFHIPGLNSLRVKSPNPISPFEESSVSTLTPPTN